MNFTIPIYIEERREKRRSFPLYSVRPLFFEKPVRRGEKLQRALTRLAGDLRAVILGEARSWRQDNLASWSDCPNFEEHDVQLSIRLRRAAAKTRFLLISINALDRRIVFTPSVPDFWFEVRRGQDLNERAEEALTHYFREREKNTEAPVRPEKVGHTGTARVSFMELSVATEKAKPQVDRPSLALLGGEEQVSGAEEFENIGRSLNAMFPDELDRAALREHEVGELTRLLQSPDRRPILLLGPRKAGKTAVLHEAVYRRTEAGGKKFGAGRQVWLISPQRLISGMTHVGQWERRLLAILKEADERDHVLYFDDLLGLYVAGLSSSSDLNAAQVMKPHLDQRKFRLLAEMEPEAFRKLQEKDRSFADLFHVIPIRETNDRDTRRILISTQRQLEERHRCRFNLDVIPAIFELQRRYAGDQAFPGKAAGFLNQLAAKHRERDIDRDTALSAFQEKSGLPRSFLDSQQKLSREDIRNTLATRIIGQPSPLDALADVISTAKARLNDPTRPLSSLLFLGPTGVGKTQCAKAAAEYLFGHASRLVRFDMNEYIDGYSVARLVGTFHEPEGLLTSAVRRQPFCVLLFDEIEKAHPAVFDVLLAALGEGRLTDALGRTANFTNCIVILTSNLGVRESRSKLGFGADNADASKVFTEAAEKFFRPEFFNRLDRVVPFGVLSREHIEKISRELIADVFERDGLRQRKCVLQIHDDAMALLVEQGCQPQLGARALKRVVEKQIAQPLAVRIAALAPGAPMLASLFPRGNEIAVKIEPLVNAPKNRRPTFLAHPEVAAETVAAMTSAQRRIEARIGELEPAGTVPLDDVSAEQRIYFALREQFKRVDGMVRRRSSSLRSSGAPRMADNPNRPRLRPSRRPGVDYASGTAYKQLAAADHMQATLDELATDEDALEKTGDLEEVAGELALLDLMAATAGCSERVALAFKVSQRRPSFQMAQIFVDHHELLDQLWGIEPVIQGAKGPEELRDYMSYCMDVIRDRDAMPLLEISGAYAAAIGRAIEGTHLILQRDGNLTPVQVFAINLEGEADARDAWKERLEEQRSWMAALARGEAGPDDDPLAIAPVVRRYEENGPTLDLRTGCVTREWPTAQDLRTFLLEQLLLPAELQSLDHPQH